LVALLEMIGGVLAANYRGVSTNGQDWLPFIAGIAKAFPLSRRTGNLTPKAFRPARRYAGFQAEGGKSRGPNPFPPQKRRPVGRHKCF